MKLMKKVACFALAMLMMFGLLTVPSFAAGEKLEFFLETETEHPELGSVFYVSVKIRATAATDNFYIPALRFYLHYSTDYFEPLGYSGIGENLKEFEGGIPSYVRYTEAFASADAMFDIADNTGVADSEKYYPQTTVLTEQQRAYTGVLVVQWIQAMDSTGMKALKPARGDGAPTQILRIGFRVKDETFSQQSLGGLLAIFKDYSYANFPFYCQYYPSTDLEAEIIDYRTATYAPASSTFPIAVSPPLRIIPSAHPPLVEAKADASIILSKFTESQVAQYHYNGLIYGFPDIYTRQGTTMILEDPQTPVALGGQGADPWTANELFNDYFVTQNGGMLNFSNNYQTQGEPVLTKPEHHYEYGTGTRVALYDAMGSSVRGVYYFVVMGDLDGNFIINLDDYLELKAMIAGERTAKLPNTASTDSFDNPYHLAGDVSDTASGSALDQQDLLTLYNAALGITPIRQPIAPFSGLVV
ncbi:MAG: hypothetical protein LBB67_01075 [Oscillospiraceae bacterium]|jgi:hypothetical protein|nr:hypothetical protein [Oscillospiraceae bacterium]